MYEMLEERDDDTTISFEMPTYIEHVNFVLNHPYIEWYIIYLDDNPIGNIYLNQDYSWGCFIKREHQGKGYGTMAFKELARLHPNKHYLANINPQNKQGKKMINELNGVLIQHTYRVKP